MSVKGLHNTTSLSSIQSRFTLFHFYLFYSFTLFIFPPSSKSDAVAYSYIPPVTFQASFSLPAPHSWQDSLTFTLLPAPFQCSHFKTSSHVVVPPPALLLAAALSSGAAPLVPKTIGNTCSFNTHKLVTSFQKSFVFSLKFWILSPPPLVSSSPCLTNPPLLFIFPLFLSYTCIHSRLPRPFLSSSFAFLQLQ